MTLHQHWEFDSECPRCGKLNHVKAPVGEQVVRVHCEHCTHGYEYTHIVQEHKLVEDRQA
ncbi:MAG: Com family DNA-binding transcriptional regulator [Alicyclobacillaceae bacterium]|uniref:Com family DNA-binding transcriptional regulator n=1 Tax=Alicyclobacillus sp. SP_1 TaxID=2942475 RepID=UPI0021583181|nr:Com family DNA-binding transcriptional regulator [Alicyclobacillus sp. SP_1]MCY0887783.1 Com family DNA-binding transcriptional regulator [Alicyclobacillaceae bacterium]MCY0896062.1 Com family DNA-binding transcriptional regulator [Alicyclobacillaceae bacterium]